MAEHSYYGMDVPRALLAGGATYYSQQDLLGNVVAVTTTSGTTARTYQYADWGAAAGTGSPIVPPGDRVRWKGALSFAEETELYYLRARWYDPGTGRFLSEDPIGLGGGINPSVFAGDEPVNGRDPDGMCEAGFELWVVYTVYNKRPLEIVRFECRPSGEGGGVSLPSLDTQCERMAAVADVLGRFAYVQTPRSYAREFARLVGGVTGYWTLLRHGTEKLAAGVSGIRPAYDDGNLQARHFAGYVAAPTYTRGATATLAWLNEHGPSGGASKEDYELALAGVRTYNALRRGELSPATVGNHIRRNICR